MLSGGDDDNEERNSVPVIGKRRRRQTKRKQGQQSKMLSDALNEMNREVVLIEKARQTEEREADVARTIALTAISREVDLKEEALVDARVQ